MENEAKLGDTIRAYQQSRDYVALAPATKRNSDKAFARLTPFMYRPIKRLTKGVMLAMMDDMPSGTAYVFGTRMRALFSFAVDRDMVDANPMVGVKMPKSGEYRPLVRQELDALLGDATDEQVRMAVSLAYYTAQRLSDVLKMRWDDINRGAIYVKQQKTKMEMFVPVHPKLEMLLAEHPKDSDYIVSMGASGQYNIDSFRKKFSRERERLGLPKDVHFHGIRKTIASELKSRGASTGEIMAMGGWTSTKQVDHYCKGSDQFAMAKAAMARMT